MKRNRSLARTALISFCCFFFSNFCLAQYSSYHTVPKIIFTGSGSEALVYSKDYSVHDSVQVVKLSVSVYNQKSPFYLDSVRFNLKGTEKLKMVSSKVPFYNGISYSLEYVFKRIPEPSPPLTLQIYSGQKLLGETKLLVDNNFIRLGLVNPNDSLTTYTYGSGCVYISSVKQLVAPKLPENYNQKNKFKHQVKPSDKFKLQER